jgi:hypothetical protein
MARDEILFLPHQLKVVDSSLMEVVVKQSYTLKEVIILRQF